MTSTKTVVYTAGSMEQDITSPMHYRIVVQGVLHPRWHTRLGGMTISDFDHEEGTSQTTLVGELVDQAALLGVLNSLYSLHMILLSVCCLPDRAACGKRSEDCSYDDDVGSSGRLKNES
jgi:hypothetical protein